jgi:hypothetical protein
MVVKCKPFINKKTAVDTRNVDQQPLTYFLINYFLLFIPFG